MTFESVNDRGMASRAANLRQVAALPWRKKNGQIEILLITSRETRRWVIPKGWPMAEFDDREAACLEAYEEAGVEGRSSKTIIGHFTYEKVMKDGDRSEVEVQVYDLEVEKPLRKWPEKDERKRQWFSAKEAADMVHEPSLKALILKLSKP